MKICKNKSLFKKLILTFFALGLIAIGPLNVKNSCHAVLDFFYNGCSNEIDTSLNSIIDSNKIKYRFFGEFDANDKFKIEIYRQYEDTASNPDLVLNADAVTENFATYFDFEFDLNQFIFIDDDGKNKLHCDIRIFRNLPNNVVTNKSRFLICEFGHSIILNEGNLDEYLKNNFMLKSADGSRTDAKFTFRAENPNSLPLVCELIPEKVDKIVNGVNCGDLVNESGLKSLEKIKIKVYKNGENEELVGELESSLKDSTSELKKTYFGFRFYDLNGHPLVEEGQSYKIVIFDENDNCLGYFFKTFTIEN